MKKILILVLIVFSLYGCVKRDYKCTAKYIVYWSPEVTKEYTDTFIMSIYQDNPKEAYILDSYYGMNKLSRIHDKNDRAINAYNCILSTTAPIEILEQKIEKY